jgi:hypothetical protein
MNSELLCIDNAVALSIEKYGMYTFLLGFVGRHGKINGPDSPVVAKIYDISVTLLLLHSLN